MSATSQLIGTKAPETTGSITLQLLDLVYTKSCICLNDVQSVFFGVGQYLTVPLPLLTFDYKVSGDIDLLNYTWSEYPYLNKQTLVNAPIKHATRFSVDLLDPINEYNPVLVALLKRQGLIELLDRYALGGGTFTVITMWGTLTNCVLESVQGINTDSGQGTQFRLNFLKPNFSRKRLTNSLNSFLSKYTKGASL